MTKTNIPVTRQDLLAFNDGINQAINIKNPVARLLFSSISTALTHAVSDKLGLPDENAEKETDTIDIDYEVVEEKVNKPKQLNIKCRPVQSEA